MDSDINTNTRLFDLVRFCRSELLQADLITFEEYAWLVSEAPMVQGKGSPSRKRLEDYDAVRAEIEDLKKEKEKYFIGKDEWGHNYLIPAAKREDWDKWRELGIDFDFPEYAVAIDGVSSIEFEY